MTISQALVIVLIIAVIVGATGTELANNTTLLIVLLIALIALAGVTYLFDNQNNNRYNRCRNRVISFNDDTNTITQTLF